MERSRARRASHPSSDRNPDWYWPRRPIPILDILGLDLEPKLTVQAFVKILPAGIRPFLVLRCECDLLRLPQLETDKDKGSDDGRYANHLCGGSPAV
jgi:hypothetical protein